MKSYDLCIVHLSDLHFSGGVGKPVMDKLIRDIGNEIQQERDVAFVVTGDLVSANKIAENRDNVVEFFKSIRDVLPKDLNLRGVELVPGNHDGLRAIDTDNYNDSTYISNLDDYDNLANDVNEVFREKNQSFNEYRRIGTTVIDFYERKIMFCRLNTASFEMPTILKEQISQKETKKQKRRDVLEKLETKVCDDFENQLQSVAGEFSKFTSNNKHCEPDLTVVLSHHPLSILRYSKYNTLDQLLFKTNFVFGDIMISGHIHSARQGFASYNTHQKIMLTTGLGWQEDPNEVLRYSIYRVNLDRKTCQISIRSSVLNEDFRQDSTSGQNEETFRHSHMTLPLKLNSVGAAIHVQSVKEPHSRSIYADINVVEKIPEVLRAFHEARKALEYKILRYGDMVRSEMEIGCYTGLWDKLLNWNKDKKKLLEAERKTVVCCKDYFEDFIQSICLHLSMMLKKLTDKNVMQDNKGHESSAGSVKWRVHARLYNGRKGSTYKKDKDSYGALFAVDIEGCKADKQPSVVPWDCLIKATYNTNSRVLVNSANPEISRTRTEWSDFLTCVPKNKTLIKVFKGRESRPLLTFGVSFDATDAQGLCDATRVLYLLAYLDIGKEIEDIIESFVYRFGLNTEDIVGCMKIKGRK